MYLEAALVVALPLVVGALVHGLRASRRGAPDALMIRPSLELPPLNRKTLLTGAYLCLLLVSLAGVTSGHRLFWLLALSGLAAAFFNPSPFLPLAGLAAAILGVSTHASDRHLEYFLFMAVLPPVVGMAASYLRAGRVAVEPDARSGALLAATYVSLALLTVVLFGLGKYPGLYPEFGLPVGAARNAAIDAWHHRYHAIGVPGTLIVIALAAAWVRSFARSIGSVAVTLGPAALFYVTALWLSPIVSLDLAVTYASHAWALVAIVTVLALAAAAWLPGRPWLHPVAFWVATVWLVELTALSRYVSEGTLG
jgi:hypothetical protein